MGIDFSHCDARWGYIGFMRFRNRVVNGAGYIGDLREMYESGKYPAGLTDDPLWPFINHSDCDGELTVEEMKQVAPRLKAVISLWPAGDTDKTKGLDLVAGMEAAIAAREPLQFM